MKKLKDRWLTPEGFKLYNDVLKCFLENGKLSLIQGLAKHEDRWDLRGITLPIDPVSGKVFQIKNCILESIDFSYATLYESVWYKCKFTNIIFYSAKADYIKFWACRFDKVVFEKTYLNEALMNATLNNDSGYFRDVHFIEANMKGTMYTNTLFERCNFLKCKLDGVDFNGSRFLNCKFTGKLSGIFFRGYPLTDFKLYPNAKPIHNAMSNIDFREAILESVTFFDKIDLSSCLFPESDDYILIRNNRKKIFEDARKEIEMKWEGMDKKIGLGLIDQYYFSQRSVDMNMELIDRHYLLRTDKDFGNRFFNLISELNERINHLG
jgi:uncharacterized protein YjbI with pentapeptide repeats